MAARHCFCLECAVADVAAVIDAFKVDFGHGLVGAGESFVEAIRPAAVTPRTRPPLVTSWLPTRAVPEWKT